MEDEIENTIQGEFLVTKLERLYKTIGRLESHGRFLKKCLTKNHIPRRLKIILEPCLAIKDKSFLKKWHSRLESFSKTIMADMIDYFDKTIERINEQIYGIEYELKTIVGKKRFNEIMETIDINNTKRKESQTEFKMAAYYSSSTKLNQIMKKKGSRKLKRSKCVKIKGLEKPVVKQESKPNNTRDKKMTILTEIAKEIHEEAKELNKKKYQIDNPPNSSVTVSKKTANEHKSKFNPSYGGMTFEKLNELGEDVQDVQTFVDNVMTGIDGFRKRLKSHPKKSLAYTKLNYYGTF